MSYKDDLGTTIDISHAALNVLLTRPSNTGLGSVTEGDMTQSTGAIVRKLFAAFIVMGCLVALPGSAAAAPISGTFDIVGLANVRVGSSWIDWGAPFNTPDLDCIPGPNVGSCAINGSTTGSIFFTAGDGSFTGIDGSLGTLLDLEDDFAPTNTAISVDDFLTMAFLPGYDFTLTFIPLGTGSAAGCTNTPGDVCTPPGSPFTITNGPDGSSSVLLNVRGTVTDGSGDTSTWIGRFTTQLDMTALEALTAIATNGFVSASQSAGFNVSFVPEPATLLTFGAGTALLAAHRRRRAKKNQA